MVYTYLPYLPSIFQIFTKQNNYQLDLFTIFTIYLYIVYRRNGHYILSPSQTLFMVNMENMENKSKASWFSMVNIWIITWKITPFYQTKSMVKNLSTLCEV